MTTHCFIPVLGKRIRVTQLDACGVPSPAGTEGAVLATDGFISLSLSSEVEDGTEIITRKASGALCVNQRASDSFKRFTVEIEFCGVNPSLLALTTNADPYKDYKGDDAGITIAEGAIDKAFALELWTGLSGQACEPGAEEASGYLLLPFVQAGVLGDISVDGENAVTFSMTGAFTKGGNAWGAGPWPVVKDAGGTDSILPEPLDPSDHLLLIDTALAPPPEACDPIPMPEPPEPVEITGVVAGAPGTFQPLNSVRPANLAALAADPVVGDMGTNKPTTAWTVGQYVDLADSTKAHWDADSWVAGVAPV
jgi:hypothetical protein